MWVVNRASVQLSGQSEMMNDIFVLSSQCVVNESPRYLHPLIFVMWVHDRIPCILPLGLHCIYNNDADLNASV